MAIKTKDNMSPEGVKALDQVRHEDDPLESTIVTLEGQCAESYAHDLAFMHEPVEVMVSDSGDKSDTTRLVPISVNNKYYFLMRGQWKTVPRFIAEILVKAKKESWSFSYKKNPDGSTSDVNSMQRSMRFPHSMRNDTPQGQKWAESLDGSFL